MFHMKVISFKNGLFRILMTSRHSAKFMILTYSTRYSAADKTALHIIGSNIF